MTEGLPDFEKDYLALQDRVAQLERLIRRTSESAESATTNADCCVDVSCRIQRETDWALTSAGVWVAVPFDGADVYDTHDLHDPVTDNSRIVCPTGFAGKYHVGGSFEWEEAATDRNVVGIAVQKTLAGGGSTTIAKDYSRLTNNTFQAFLGNSIGVDIDLAEGDYVEILARSSFIGDALTVAGFPTPVMNIYGWAHRFAVA